MEHANVSINLFESSVMRLLDHLLTCQKCPKECVPTEALCPRGLFLWEHKEKIKEALAESCPRACPECYSPKPCVTKAILHENGYVEFLTCTNAWHAREEEHPMNCFEDAIPTWRLKQLLPEDCNLLRYIFYGETLVLTVVRTMDTVIGVSTGTAAVRVNTRHCPIKGRMKGEQANEARRKWLREMIDLELMWMYAGGDVVPRQNKALSEPEVG